MNANTRLKRALSMILCLVLVISLLPLGAYAADSSQTANTIFFATDRHEESSKLNSLLNALEYEPGLVVLGGDHVNNTNSGSLASITSEIQAVFPGVQTFYTYAAHDPNVSEDSSNPYAYARTGEVYEGAEYYVYALDQEAMSSSSTASSASSAFKNWAASADSSKVIFVMCHMPIHNRRGDNAGGATWMNALNEVGESHDVVYLWGHNHTGENSTDTSVYFVSVGGSLTPQGGSTGTINFTYMNAGYIKNGYCSQVVVNGDHVAVTRYNTSGSATASYTIERRFGISHTWEVTEYVAPTCTTDGYQTVVCADCGETKTSVIAASGHDYSSVIQNTCTGSYTIYTCDACGYSYSVQNPNETTYDAVSSLENGASYVIVSSNYALTYGSKAGKTSVSVSNGSITSDVTDTMIWKYENGVLSNDSSGSVKYIKSSSRSISFSTSGSSASYSGNKLKLGSYYLYYSSNSGFSARSSGSTVTLYKVNESVGGVGEHVYETVTVQPTCKENGSVTYTCSICGYSYSEVISSTGAHNYVTETVNATCAADGSVTYTCTVCGDNYMEIIPAAGHNYESVVTAPSCTEAGYTTVTCTVCGDSYTTDQTAALGHTYAAVTVDATCTTDGMVTYTCSCGTSYSEIIPATGHDYEAVVTAPSCTEAGYTTVTCTACGDFYITEETEALGHDMETVVYAATCTEGGYTAETCVRCGIENILDETSALGHTYYGESFEATCTEDGYTLFTCDRCGDSYVGDVIAALGHNYDSAVTAATCTEGGYTIHTCSLCGDVVVDSYVEALGHAFETQIQNATCTEAGSVTSTCTVCGVSSVEIIPAAGHSWKTVTVNATCTEPGSVTNHCSACGEEEVEILPALGHAYESVVTAPTCTEGGYTTHTCANCGDSYIGDETAALGHAYGGVVTAPTCTEGGYTTHTCANCGDSYIGDETTALGHAYEGVVTAPTCTEGGYTTHTCANCGDSYIGDETAALGHEYESVVTAPTCTEGGYTTYTCANCGDSYVSNQVSALGHNYICTENGNMLVYTCEHCGDSYTESLEVSYSYQKVSSFDSGENYVVTLVSGNKYYALSHENNKISLVQIYVSGNEITSEITEDLLWSYSDKKLSYESDNETYYLNVARSGGWFSSMTVGVSTSASSNVTFSNNKIKVGSYYLSYSNGSVRTSSRSSSTAYLFKQVEE